MRALRCIVLGGGGHTRVLLEILRACGHATAVAILDPAVAVRGGTLDGVPFGGSDEALPQFFAMGVRHFVLGLGGSGDNRPRRALFERALSLGFKPLTLIHPRALVSPMAALGGGCQVMAGAIIQAGAEIGRNVIINTGAIVDHDCRIADHVHVASGACLCGAVHVFEEAHIGAGSVVRQGLRIGARSLVAAGAAVIADVIEEQRVGGVPARSLSAPAAVTKSSEQAL